MGRVVGGGLRRVAADSALGAVDAVVRGTLAQTGQSAVAVDVFARVAAPRPVGSDGSDCESDGQ